MSFAANQAWAVKVGHTFCYMLDFYQLDSRGVISGQPILQIGTSTHLTSIEATMPAGLAGGRYTFTISGLSDSDYALIQPNESQSLAVKLYLFWGDAVKWEWSSVGDSILSYFGNMIGTNTAVSSEEKEESLVSVLSLIRVRREAGTTRYKTIIDATELVARRLKQTMTGSRPDATDYRSAISTLSELAGVPVTIHPASGNLTADRAADTGSETYAFGPDRNCGQSLIDIATRIETNLNRRGRGMLLIRDGALHVGLRPIPLRVTEPAELVPSTGLLSVTPLDTLDSDPFAAYSFVGDSASAPQPPRRTRFSIQLKGRPDIKPGDAVKFDIPVQSSTTLGSVGAAMVGSFAGSILESDALSPNAVIGYVTTVSHRQSAESGFFTTLEVASTTTLNETDVWDVQTEVPNPTSPPNLSASADGATRAASAIRSTSATRSSRLGLDVGEVREATASGTSEPPGQSARIWLGINGDGRPNGSRRIEINRVVRTEKPGVGYVSPFVWGKAGLILPRYPGMRVVLGFLNGSPDDAIDLGAMGRSSLINQAAQAGDYWLSLPANVPAERRASISSDASPSEFENYTDVVSQDLIDADGNRVIETAEFTIRVSDKSSLKAAGTRPDRPDEQNSVTIEHVDNGAKIVLKANGEILIEGKKITFDAGNGDIELKARSVDVQVTSEMNVH